MSGEKTDWIWTEQQGAKGNENKPTIKGFTEHDPTRPMNETPQSRSDNLRTGGDSDSTQFYVPPEESDGFDIEPVCGWLVIVKGPGKGASLSFGAGQSIIGRDSQHRVALPYGDRSISRSHARIVYDPASRKFFLAPGDGKNLTRVNGDLVMSNVELSGGELIDLGNTQVRFVPFCNSAFDWADVAEEDDE